MGQPAQAAGPTGQGQHRLDSLFLKKKKKDTKGAEIDTGGAGQG